MDGVVRRAGILARMRTVTLKAGSSKPLWMGHPWVYADSVERIDEGTDDWVRVADSRGKVVGRGWLSPQSTIRVRILDRGEEGLPEADLLATRVQAAVALRRRLFLDPTMTDAYRLVHAEGDGLPGLVVDRFGPVLVAQFSTRPLVARRAVLAGMLLAASGARSLLSRPGGKEEEEGIAGDEVSCVVGDPAPDRVEIVEEGLRLAVDLRRGQKTGHYVDQRENRRLVASAAAGARVLDLYAGTGGFGLRALLAGAAHAVAVDSSGPALETARENAVRNAVAPRYETVEADAMEHLATLARAKTEYDVVVVDPPRFAATRAGLPRAIDAYRRLNVRAMTRVAPGGLLATFSCSGLVEPEPFAEMVRAAGRECRRTLSVLRTFTAGPDHPVDLSAPEGRYLTGLLLSVRP